MRDLIVHRDGVSQSVPVDHDGKLTTTKAIYYIDKEYTGSQASLSLGDGNQEPYTQPGVMDAQ